MQTKQRSTYERIVWEEGLEEGQAQGRAQGQLQGLEQGRQAAARDLLLDLLHDRFGPCGESLVLRIQAIRDEARLRALARAVPKALTLADFEDRIGG